MTLAEGVHSIALPPPDARLIDHRKEKIPTPVDERGLIIIDQLIQDVNETIVEAYEYTPGLSVHHFYFPENQYPSTPGPDPSANPSSFRNLAIHKGLVLREFENWLHAVTLPAPVPHEEVRRHRVESWVVARELFRMARMTVQWERMARRRKELVASNPNLIPKEFDGQDVIGEEIMQEILEKYFRGFEHQLKRNEQIPIEFRLVELNQPPAKIAQDLGKIVMPKSIILKRAVAA